MKIRNAVYGSIIAVCSFTAGDRAEHYVHTLPTEAMGNELYQELTRAREELGKYITTLINGKQAKINPDMSVTVSGIDGDVTEDVDLREFRSWKK